MNDWTRRIIGPGRNRDAAPTQPLDDTPAAARTLGWLPTDVLADAVEQEAADSVADAHMNARIAEYAVAAALGFALGVLIVALSL